MSLLDTASVPREEGSVRTSNLNIAGNELGEHGIAQDRPRRGDRFGQPFAQRRGTRVFNLHAETDALGLEAEQDGGVQQIDEA